MIRRYLLRLVLVALTVGGLLPLGAAFSWFLDLFAHFRLHYVGIAGLAIVIAIVGRERALALLLAGVAAINAWPLLPYAMPAAEVPKGFGFSTMAFNVNSGNRAYSDIAELIASADADLVAVVELTPRLDRALAAVHEIYPYRYLTPDVGWFGLGIFSKYPLIATQPVAAPRMPAIEATVALPTGNLRFIATHLRSPIGERAAGLRNRQLDALVAQVRSSDLPVVVCGDFNLTPYSPWFREFTEQSGLVDARLGKGFDFSWPSFLPIAGIPIDHCLTRGPLTAASVDRLAPNGSDHYPVAVEFVWDEPE